MKQLLRKFTRTFILIPLWFYVTFALIYMFSKNPSVWLSGCVVDHFKFECPLVTIMVTLAFMGYAVLTVMTWGTYILGRR